MASFLSIGEEKLRSLKDKLAKDATKLPITFSQGWPEGKHLLPYYFRDKCQDGH